MIATKHDLFEKIISDRDKLFTSKFWKALTEQIEIHRKLSTAYHSQTNEQTKKMNQILKQYLRHYVNYRQTNWVQLLSIAQFTYNSTCTNTTEVLSFYANHEYDSEMTKHEITIVRAQRANILMTQLRDLHKKLAMNLKFIAQRAKIYYDKKQFEKIDLKMKKKHFC